jgi:hypothetical protein
MNQLTSAILGSLGRTVRYLEDAAQDIADFDTWSSLLMLAAPYKAALVEARRSNYDRALIVRYLRAAQMQMQGGGLTPLLGATEQFADALESYDERPASLGKVRELGNAVQVIAYQTAEEYLALARGEEI